MQQVRNQSVSWQIVGILVLPTVAFGIVAFIGFGTNRLSPNNLITLVSNVIPAPEVMVEIDRAHLALNEQLSIYRNTNFWSVILAAIGALITVGIGLVTAAFKAHPHPVKVLLLVFAIGSAACTGGSTLLGNFAKTALEGATEIETVVNTVLDDIEKDSSPGQNTRHVLKLQRVIGKYSSAKP